MSGDFTAGSRVLARWQKERLERDEWERANPALAAAWQEALEERWRREEEAERAAEEARARAMVPEKLARLGVPPRCIDLLDTLQRTPAVESALSFVDGEASFLLLTGGTGSGKTVASVLALSQVVQRTLKERPRIDSFALGRVVAFVRAAEMSRAAIQDYNPEAQARFEDWCKCRWLVIDDIGAEPNENSRWLSAFDLLIDRRYGFDCKTILTSNLDGASFRKRYGERVTDRIKHDGGLESSGGESLRRNEVKLSVVQAVKR